MSMHKNKNEHLTLEEARGEGLKRTELKKKAHILRELQYVLKVNFDIVLLLRLHSVDDLRVVQPRWHAWLLMSACKALIKSSRLRRGALGEFGMRGKRNF